MLYILCILIWCTFLNIMLYLESIEIKKGKYMLWVMKAARLKRGKYYERPKN